MTLSRLNNFDSRYREIFGNHDIRQFVVSTDHEEQVGKVVDVLADEMGHSRYLVVQLEPAIAQKQVLIPIERFQSSSNAQQIYLKGLSSAQVSSLPDYKSNYDQSTVSKTDRLDESSDKFNGINGTLETVRLLEEKLIVDRQKRKIGEIIVRKEIETHIVEVPVRREKLIVEQVGLELKQLASIDLGDPSNNGFNSVEIREVAGARVPSSITGEFVSVKMASQFLQAIADQPDSGCEKVQINLTLSDPKLQEVYQQWLERYSAIQPAQPPSQPLSSQPL